VNTSRSGSKENFIKAYFEEWNSDLSWVEGLLSDGTHYLGVILILSCYVGCLGLLRYPACQDNEAYKRVVLEYSGMKDSYEEIDLFFFLRWPLSELRGHGSYRTLKNHPEISTAIIQTFGDENAIRGGKRYVKQQEILHAVTANPFPQFDCQNLTQHLPLFSCGAQPSVPLCNPRAFSREGDSLSR
jgi:hypothetical protein